MGANLDNIHEIYNILCHKNEKNAYIITLLAVSCSSSGTELHESFFLHFLYDIDELLFNCQTTVHVEMIVF